MGMSAAEVVCSELLAVVATLPKAVGLRSNRYGLLLNFGTHQDRACDQGDAGSSANVLASAARLWNFLR